MKWFGKNISDPSVWSSIPTEVQAVIQEWQNQDQFISAKTSGSTGVPKTIQLQKSEVNASAKLTAATFGIAPGATILHNLPVQFIAGKVMLFRALVNDWNVVYVEPAVNFLIPHEEIHFAAFTPLQLTSLIQNQRERLDQIGTMIIGGGEVSLELKHQLIALKGRVFATYGMTETITHIAWSDLKEDSIHTWFTPLKGVFVSSSTDSTLTIQATHLGNRIIQTHDLIEFDACGRFRICGRVDFIINSGGLKVNPIILEEELNLILKQPFFIGGKKDAVLGQRVVLYVEGKVADEMKDRIILLFGNRADRPREICEVTEFEYTATGKLIRKEY